ncbi:alpha/beta fold hydrolase [Pelatocladus sp. BLCC-F211]|uniref:alpha/beta fold hydrolase n=1 Tax=Pelatocladus sp. BLCC-F211 TaxID=3342752 RepID=UPI0035B73EC6
MKKATFQFLFKNLNLIGYFSPSIAGYMVFYLFCRPSSPAAIGRSQIEMMTSAYRYHISINGKQVAVYRWGDGTNPVLLVHGWGSRAASFTKLAKKLLDAEYSPIAFDAPAHGESDGKTTTILEYEEICKQLSQEYGRFSAVIGHSFGILGLFKALKSSVLVDKVVSISGVCDFSFLEQEFSRKLRLSHPVQENLKKRIENLFAPIKDIWQTFSVNYNAGKISVPVLIVYDDDDDVVPQEQTMKIFNAYNHHSEIYKTQNLGHQRILLSKDVIQKIVNFIMEEPIKV